MRKSIMWGTKLLIAICFIWISVYAFDLQYILGGASRILGNALILGVMVVSYSLAFLLKAKAWQLYVGKDIGFKPYMDGVFYSLFINHLLPVKAGDLVRIGYLAQWKKVAWVMAFQSVLVMRFIDLLILGSIALVGAFYLGISISVLFLVSLLFIVGAGIGLLIIKANWRTILFTHLIDMVHALWSFKGVLICCLIFLSWCLEAIVLLAVTSEFNFSLSYLPSLWVNSFTIAGQVFHFSPGGIGTYESFMSFALTVLAIPLKDSYTIAILTHGFKFLFSFAIGVYLIISAPISWKTVKVWLKRKED